MLGKVCKVVWIDDTISKAIIGNLLDYEKDFVTIKTLHNQTFMIKTSTIISLYEYKGDLQK